jgi:fructose/tagatose bisphosphate aldolase
VQRTGCDSLAVAIGSVHAMREAKAELDIERLKAIKERVQIPFVLHGSSGVSEESEIEAIQHGIAKINVATLLNVAFTQGMMQAIQDLPGNVDPRKFLINSRDEVKEVVRHKMRLFGCSGTVRNTGFISPKTTHRTAELGGAEE